MFDEFDTNGDGVLEGDEYMKCVKACAEHMKEEMKKGLLAAVTHQQAVGDVKPNIDVEALVRDAFNLKYDEERMLTDASLIADPDQDRKITREEWYEACEKLKLTA